MSETKKLKTVTDEGEAPVKQNCKVETDNITNAGTEEETDLSLKLAVVLEGFPGVKMTEEQAEVLEALLVESINPADQGRPIQFSATQYEDGALVFTCVNRKTHSWLRKTVQRLVPWPGARLEVGQAESTLKGTKFILWVNEKMGLSKRSYQQILDLVQKQNKGISTTEWRVIRGVAETGKDERLVLWVDNKSYEDLKTQNFKLFLGLAQVRFMLMSEWKKLKSGSHQSPAAQNLPRRGAPKFPYRNLPRPLLPDSGSRAAGRSRGRGFSGPNRVYGVGHSGRAQRRDFEFNTGLLDLREAQFLASDLILARERTFTNRESTFRGSQNPRFRGGFSPSERSQSRGASYVVPGRGQRREARYTSNRIQERRYFPSDRRQPRGGMRGSRHSSAL